MNFVSARLLNENVLFSYTTNRKEKLLIGKDLFFENASHILRKIFKYYIRKIKSKGWNLLAYIEKLKKDGRNTNEKHKLLMECESKLKEDWTKFQNDPFWLVKEYNENIL